MAFLALTVHEHFFVSNLSIDKLESHEKGIDKDLCLGYTVRLAEGSGELAGAEKSISREGGVSCYEETLSRGEYSYDHWRI